MLSRASAASSWAAAMARACRAPQAPRSAAALSRAAGVRLPSQHWGWPCLPGPAAARRVLGSVPPCGRRAGRARPRRAGAARGPCRGRACSVWAPCRGRAYRAQGPCRDLACQASGPGAGTGPGPCRALACCRLAASGPGPCQGPAVPVRGPAHQGPCWRRGWALAHQGPCRGSRPDLPGPAASRRRGRAAAALPQGPMAASPQGWACQVLAPCQGPSAFQGAPELLRR
mmetsp:Transcript_90720/g.280579  ORF Transcript_90720/g.280579 Transcript_90720/m.280579 type:complete len:229 (-) Transcript_90720:2203-2889(-)